MRIPLTIFILLILNGCSSTYRSSNNLAEVVNDYFSVYSQRNDFERLISFYAEDAIFEDIIYGNLLKNKTGIKNFLAWDKGEFKVLSGPEILSITKQVVGENHAVTEGFFHGFSYDGQQLGPWLFVIIQEFDSSNKIIKQTDWINYTPREKFFGGKNMNKELINK